MGGAIGPVVGRLGMAAAANSPILSGLGALTGATPTNPNPLAGGGVQGVAAGNPFQRVFDTMAAQSQSQAGPAPTVGGVDPSAQTAATNIASLPPAPTANVPNMATTPGMRKYEPAARQAAAKWGIDPDTFVRVLNAEGGLDDWIQSKVTKNGVREPSYGPGQFLIGGGNTGFPEGLGNRFIKDTGLDPRNPANAAAYFDYMGKEVSQRGFGQWYGAKAAGIGNFEGVGGNPVKGHSPQLDQVQGGVRYTGGSPTAGGQAMGLGSGGELPGTGGFMGGADSQPPQSAFERVIAALGKGKGGTGASMGVAQDQSADVAPAVDLGAEEVASTQQALQQKRLGATTGGAEQRKAAIRQRVGYKA